MITCQVRRFNCKPILQSLSRSYASVSHPDSQNFIAIDLCFLPLAYRRVILPHLDSMLPRSVTPKCRCLIWKRKSTSTTNASRITCKSSVDGKSFLYITYRGIKLHHVILLTSFPLSIILASPRIMLILSDLMLVVSTGH